MSIDIDEFLQIYYFFSMNVSIINYPHFKRIQIPFEMHTPWHNRTILLGEVIGDDVVFSSTAFVIGRFYRYGKRQILHIRSGSAAMPEADYGHLHLSGTAFKVSLFD